MSSYELLLNPIDSALQPSFLSQILFSVERVRDQDGSLSLIGAAFHLFTVNKLTPQELERHLLQGSQTLFGEKEMIKNVTRFILHVIPLDQRTPKQQAFVRMCSKLGLIDLDAVGIPVKK